jgi:hypothetical protein
MKIHFPSRKAEYFPAAAVSMDMSMGWTMNIRLGMRIGMDRGGTSHG